MIPGSCSWLNAGAGQCRQMRAACRVPMIWMLIFCQRWRLYKSCCSKGKVRSDAWNFSLWCSLLISQSPIDPTSLFWNMANNAYMHCHLPTPTHTHVCIHTHPNWHTYIYMYANIPYIATIQHTALIHWHCQTVSIDFAISWNCLDRFWNKKGDWMLKVKHMLHIFLTEGQRGRERVMTGQFVWIVYHQNLDCQHTVTER